MTTELPMHLAWVASACVLVAAILYRTLIHRNPLDSFPGPWHTRYSNLRLKLAVITGQRMYYIHSLHSIYGPFVRISPTELAVNDRPSLTEIHRVGSDFVKSPWYRQITASIPRDTVFTMQDRKLHAARRRLLSRPFSRTSLLTQWEGTVRDMIDFAVERIRHDATAGQCDVMKWWTLMASDISARLMFGHSLGHLQHGEFSNLLRIVTSRLVVNGIAVELPFFQAALKALQYLPIKAVQDVTQSNDALVDYGKAFLSSIKSSDGATSIFSNMAQQAEKGEHLDDIDVQSEASGLIVAGSDTTAVTLTYLVYCVLSNPTVQNSLEHELSSLGDQYSDEYLDKLPFLRAVIEETLRLYGAAPGGLPRTTPPQGFNIGGHFVPGGTTVTTQAYSFHRDGELFPRPNEFLPSRWLDGSISPEALKSFHPFGLGSRTCLGIHLAYMELRLATAAFFRRCRGARLHHSTTEETMVPDNYFLISPRGHACHIVLS